MMKIEITRQCFVAGKSRAVGDIVECDAKDAGPAIGANRARVAADDAKPPKASTKRRTATTTE